MVSCSGLVSEQSARGQLCPFTRFVLGDSVRCADPILYAFNVRSDMAKEMNVPFTECEAHCILIIQSKYMSGDFVLGF